ncbi:AglZ/HisF2 family acetamidino modification protein [soil metagenome]
MLKTRVIPCLLLKNSGLVKTVKFKDPRYLGDPINTVKIFNDSGVDELTFLDITATNESRKPDFKFLSDIASECFMPLGYGGALRSISDIEELLNIGIEKAIINSYAVENSDFVKEASEKFGSSTIVISIDVKRSLFGKYEVYTHSGKLGTKLDPVEFAKTMENNGAGEILLNSIDRDGSMKGYDLEILEKVSKAVSIPVIACGGAGSLSDFSDAVKNTHISAVAAGSLFVFQGPHKAVLINFPTEEELEKIF